MTPGNVFLFLPLIEKRKNSFSHTSMWPAHALYYSNKIFFFFQYSTDTFRRILVLHEANRLLPSLFVTYHHTLHYWPRGVECIDVKGSNKIKKIKSKFVIYIPTINNFWFDFLIWFDPFTSLKNYRTSMHSTPPCSIMKRSDNRIFSRSTDESAFTHLRSRDHLS
jgi:hypothetical protein